MPDDSTDISADDWGAALAEHTAATAEPIPSPMRMLAHRPLRQPRPSLSPMSSNNLERQRDNTVPRTMISI